jgi:hypothetical protein
MWFEILLSKLSHIKQNFRKISKANQCPTFMFNAKIYLFLYSNETIIVLCEYNDEQFVKKCQKIII